MARFRIAQPLVERADQRAIAKAEIVFADARTATSGRSFGTSFALFGDKVFKDAVVAITYEMRRTALGKNGLGENLRYCMI